MLHAPISELVVATPKLSLFAARDAREIEKLSVAVKIVSILSDSQTSCTLVLIAACRGSASAPMRDESDR